MGRGGQRSLAGFAAAVIGAAVMNGLTLQPALAVHSVFDANPFTSGSDVVTGFSSLPHGVCHDGGSGFPDIGPVGLLDDGNHFFVDNLCTQTLYRLPPGGGSVAGTFPHLKDGLTGGLTRVGGVYYGLIQNRQFPAPPPFGGKAGLYTFDPNTLRVTYIVSFPGDGLASGTHDRTVVGDSSGANLYVGTDNGIYKVTLPGHAVTRFDKCSPPRASPACSGNFDQLAFSLDGKILYAADPEVNSNVIEFDLSGNPLHATQMLAGAKQGPDGLVVAPAGSMPNGIRVGGNLFINTNDGHVLRYTGPGSVTEAASGGSRGDLATTDPLGCIYVTQSDSIEKLLPCLGPATDRTTLTIQTLDSCRQAVGGAMFTLKDSSGTVVGTQTGSPGSQKTVARGGSCPIQAGDCVHVPVGCATFTVTLPATGTETFTLIETAAPSGYVPCKGGSACQSESMALVVDSLGNVQATTTNVSPDGSVKTFPTTDPNTGFPYWLATPGDPGLMYDDKLGDVSCDGDADADDHNSGSPSGHCDSDHD